MDYRFGAGRSEAGTDELRFEPESCNAKFRKGYSTIIKTVNVNKSDRKQDITLIPKNGEEGADS